MSYVYRLTAVCLFLCAVLLQSESATPATTPNRFFDARAKLLLPSSNSESQMLIDTAHSDARNILSEHNSCSRFFGGSRDAVFVLDKLAGRMQPVKVAIPQVGIRMTGTVRDIGNVQTGLRYRLFEKVLVNIDGPFYRVSCRLGFFANFGSFAPNTREIRVIMLLHELAHMIKGADGNWLIPDDGNNWTLSAHNTLLIEEQCGDHIRELEK